MSIKVKGVLNGEAEHKLCLAISGQPSWEKSKHPGKNSWGKIICLDQQTVNILVKMVPIASNMVGDNPCRAWTRQEYKTKVVRYSCLIPKTCDNVDMADLVNAALQMHDVNGMTGVVTCHITYTQKTNQCICNLDVTEALAETFKSCDRVLSVFWFSNWNQTAKTRPLSPLQCLNPKFPPQLKVICLMGSQTASKSMTLTCWTEASISPIPPASKWHWKCVIENGASNVDRISNWLVRGNLWCLCWRWGWGLPHLIISKVNYFIDFFFFFVMSTNHSRDERLRWTCNFHCLQGNMRCSTLFSYPQGIDILFLMEPPNITKYNTLPDIPDNIYNCFAEKLGHAALVTKGFTSWRCPQHCAHDIVVCQAKLNDHITYLVSMYMDQNIQDFPKEFKDLVCKCGNADILIGTNSNSHCTVWNCTETGNRGEFIEDFLIKNNLACLNIGNNWTFESAHGFKSIIDITLANYRLA